MSELNENKDYDFKLQLEAGQKAEGFLKKLLVGGKEKFEVKSESKMWHDTGNIVVEYESHEKPSGIASTKADYWVHELKSREGETLVYLLFPTPVLRKMCNDVMEEDGGRIGGEGKKMKMVLLNLEKILNRLRHFSGKGDERFTSKKSS